MGHISLSHVTTKSGGRGGHGLSNFMDDYPHGSRGGNGGGILFGIPANGSPGECAQNGGNSPDLLICYGGCGGTCCGGGSVQIIGMNNITALHINANAESFGGDGGSAYGGNGGNGGDGGDGGTGLLFQATGGNGGNGGNGGSVGFAIQFGGYGGSYAYGGTIDIAAVGNVAIESVTATSISSGGNGGSAIAGNGGLAGFAGQNGQDVAIQVLQALITILEPLNAGISFVLDHLGLKSLSFLNIAQDLIDLIQIIEHFYFVYKMNSGLCLGTMAGANGACGGSGGMANQAGDGDSAGGYGVGGCIRIITSGNLILSDTASVEVISKGGNGGYSVAGNGGIASKGVIGGTGDQDTGANGGPGGFGGHGGYASYGGKGGNGGDAAIGGTVSLTGTTVTLKSANCHLNVSGGTGGTGVAGFGAAGGAGGNGGGGPLTLPNVNPLKKLDKKAKNLLKKAETNLDKISKNVVKAPDSIFTKIGNTRKSIENSISKELKNVATKIDSLTSGTVFSHFSKPATQKLNNIAGGILEKQAMRESNFAFKETLQQLENTLTKQAMTTVKETAKAYLKTIGKRAVITSLTSNGQAFMMQKIILSPSSFSATDTTINLRSGFHFTTSDQYLVLTAVSMPQSALSPNNINYTTDTFNIYAAGGLAGDGGDSGRICCVQGQSCDGGNGGTIQCLGELLIYALSFSGKQINLSGTTVGGSGGNLVFGRRGPGGLGGAIGNSVTGGLSTLIQDAKIMGAVLSGPTNFGVWVPMLGAQWALMCKRTIQLMLVRIIAIMNVYLNVDYSEEITNIIKKIDEFNATVQGWIADIVNIITDNIPKPALIVIGIFLLLVFAILIPLLAAVYLAFQIILEFAKGIIQSSLIGLAGAAGENTDTPQTSDLVAPKTGTIGSNGTTKDPGYFWNYGQTCQFKMVSLSDKTPLCGIAVRPIAHINLATMGNILFRTRLRISSAFNDFSRDLPTEPTQYMTQFRDKFMNSININAIDNDNKIVLGSINASNIYELVGAASISTLIETEAMVLPFLIFNPTGLLTLPIEYGLYEFAQELNSLESNSSVNIDTFFAQEAKEQILTQYCYSDGV